MMEEALIKALREHGFTAPETDDEARACLKRLDQLDIMLPGKLADTPSAIRRILNNSSKEDHDKN